MTLKEKLAMETGQQIYLYKQGVFWVAYEQSALILSRYKPLKLSVKFVKTVNQQVISAGFPEATLSYFSSLFGDFTETGKNAGYFELRDTDTEIDLSALRDEIFRQQPVLQVGNPNPPPDLPDQILGFHLAEKTPLEAMLFIKDLQDQIRQAGVSDGDL